MITNTEQFEIYLNMLDELNKITQAKIDDNVQFTYQDLQKYDNISKQLESLIKKEEV